MSNIKEYTQQFFGILGIIGHILILIELFATDFLGYAIMVLFILGDIGIIYFSKKKDIEFNKITAFFEYSTLSTAIYAAIISINNIDQNLVVSSIIVILCQIISYITVKFDQFQYWAYIWFFAAFVSMLLLLWDTVHLDPFSYYDQVGNPELKPLVYITMYVTMLAGTLVFMLILRSIPRMKDFFDKYDQYLSVYRSLMKFISISPGYFIILILGLAYILAFIAKEE